MFKASIIMFVIFRHSFSFNKFETNVESIMFGFPDSNCLDNNYVINFSDAFEYIPQIIILPNYWSMKKVNAELNEMSFQIIDTQTTQFTVNFKCPNPAKVFAYYFRWAAVHDKRIEVINVFDFDTTGLGIYNFPAIPHSNINALYGFINLVSFSFSGIFTFQLQIVQITSSEVYVKLITQQNLISVGFQIVLGTVDALSISDLIEFDSLSSTNIYKSDSLTVETGTQLWLPLQGFSYTLGDNFKLHFEYSDSGSTIQYNFTGGKTFYIVADYNLLNFFHRQVWFQTINDFPPFLQGKMRISKYFMMPLYNYFIQLQIDGLDSSHSYKSPVSETLYIKNTITTINIIATFQCPTDQKITGYILKCTKCNKDKTFITNFCYGSINYITHFIQLNQANQENSEILVQITSVSITITQTLTDEIGKIYTILSLLFQ